MQSIGRDARIAGLLYLILVLLGLFSLIYVPERIIVHGNAAATTANIVANESLLRLSIYSELIAIVVELFVSLALYRLFERVDRGQATLLVILGGILPVPIYFMNALNWVGALLMAKGGGVYTALFSVPERQGWVMLFISLHHYGFLASAVFAGLWLLPMGWLTYRSGFLPRFLGIWLIIGGVTYVAQSFVGFVLPQYQDALEKVAFPLELGEIAFMLWLLIVGAREPKLSKAANAYS
jgi:Domain of unknown function (DUF4386)